ncbi:HWE histidine kinase domain-containing protein [Bradyrhizobium sp.]|uniref:sensor histidine kinase n=1 Tax=Bradyrhizobium sp. TaxID=376 RepID=UPI001D74834F|nr:HWE histidine kinase domain-containing protein [Bradyrhizobium sp.]MBI5320800.1 PAS domain-containing protein [Bradyrhizobium sp.]
MTGLVWDVNKLRIATDAAGIALWSWNVDTDRLEMDERGHVLWGVPNTGVITFEVLSACIHPEDLDRVRAAFAATRDVLGGYETDFRILCDGKVRWISARGRGDDQGIVGRIMYGVFIDVTERKKAEEAREMLAGEMNHRVKNIFAITSALTTISARSTTTKDEMVKDVRQRIMALSRAHDMVRPDFGQQKKAAQLGDLLGTLLAPYANAHSETERVHISTPKLLVGEKSATTLALVVHELATNSVKYGALSTANGTLDIKCSVTDGEVTVVWSENGGPLVFKPSGQSGFGTKLVVSSLSDQLGGTISASWPPAGAVITLKMSEARLGA